MRTEKRAVVLAICLLTLGALWLGSPREAAAGPAIYQSRLKQDLSESACVRKAERSVADLQRMDREIRTRVDDDTVWLSNDSFTAMVLCMGLRAGETMSLIVVASNSGDLARAMRDNLKRRMD